MAKRGTQEANANANAETAVTVVAVTHRSTHREEDRFAGPPWARIEGTVTFADGRSVERVVRIPLSEYEPLDKAGRRALIERVLADAEGAV